jgi:hypothetical protein
MVFPLALAVCENDLKRDLTFLKAFAGQSVDLRVTPIRGGTLNERVARVIAHQLEAAVKAGLKPQAIVVHQDVDRRSLAASQASVRRWFDAARFAERGCRLVTCTPEPCIERWLCVAARLGAVRGASPSGGCQPWKAAWSKRKEPDLDRVRKAAAEARTALRGLPDFDAFFDSWVVAGMEPAASST